MTLRNEDKSILIKLYLEKARESLDDAKSETASPSARVNRAYYSMFNCATAMLLAKNITRSSHKGILSEFGKEFVRAGVLPKALGDDLRELEKRRYSADYIVRAEITKELADDSSQRAERFYEVITKELSKEEG